MFVSFHLQPILRNPKQDRKTTMASKYRMFLKTKYLTTLGIHTSVCKEDKAYPGIDRTQYRKRSIASDMD